MIRSLLAIIVATVTGFASAKFVEGAGLSLGGAGVHNIALLLGWGIGAFVAAVTALIIGQRWAPLGWLAAATVLLASVLALSAGQTAIYMWPVAFGLITAGAFGAQKITGARATLTIQNKASGLFDD